MIIDLPIIVLLARFSVYAILVEFNHQFARPDLLLLFVTIFSLNQFLRFYHIFIQLARTFQRSTLHFSHEWSKYKVHDRNIPDPPGSCFIYYSRMVFYLILLNFELNLMQPQDAIHFSKYSFLSWFSSLSVFHHVPVYSLSMTGLQLFAIIAETSIIQRLNVIKII